MKRIHVPNMGPDPVVVPKAFAIGLRECKAFSSAVLTIITPVKDNLDSIVIGDVLGRDAAKKLMKGYKVPIGDHGVSFRHESVSTVQKCATPRVAIAFYVSMDDIQRLDDLGFDCLIFVPWLDKEGEQWAAKWDAETMGAKTQDAAVILPSEVIVTLKNLTAMVNLSTGLGHPLDKTRAKEKFAELRAQGVRWNPSEIEKWAV